MGCINNLLDEDVCVDENDVVSQCMLGYPPSRPKTPNRMMNSGGVCPHIMDSSTCVTGCTFRGSGADYGLRPLKEQLVDPWSLSAVRSRLLTSSASACRVRRRCEGFMEDGEGLFANSLRADFRARSPLCETSACKHDESVSKVLFEELTEP